MTCLHLRRRLGWSSIIVLLVIGNFCFTARYAFRKTPVLTPMKNFVLQKAMTKEATCVKEVLEALRLPLSRPDYKLESFEHPLDLKLLSKSCQNFIIPRTVSEKRRKELKCFFPEILPYKYGPMDRERIKKGLVLIRAAFDRAHIPLGIDWGSAIGSWRMHGHIPYDLDNDVFVPMRYKSRVINLIKALKTMYPSLIYAYEDMGNLWKIRIIRRFNGSFLRNIDVNIIDIQDYLLRAEKMRPETKINGHMFLPYIQRPFEGMLFRTWRKTKQYIEQKYGKAADVICRPTPWMSRTNWEVCKSAAVKCSELEYFYNFVRRWEHEDGTFVEVLFNRSHALDVFYSPDGI